MGAKLQVRKNFPCCEVLELKISLSDERVYLPIELYGLTYSGLLDSGANRSVIGRKGWDKLSKLDIPLHQSFWRNVRVANGQTSPVLGVVEVTISFENISRVVSFVVVPDLPHEIILGMDFWRLFGVRPDVSEMNCLIRDYSPSKLPSVLLNIYTQDQVDFIDVADMVVSADKLAPDQANSLESLINRFKPTLGRAELGCTTLIKHSIDTGNAKPVRRRYHSYSPKLIEVLHSGLEEWLQQGVVEKSKSPWASPVLLVKKRDNSYRWVVDLREVNKVTKGDSYPLPKVNDILDQLRDAKFISSIDLSSAYFQVPLEESSKEKTAFIIPGKGLYQFKRMPQGLHTSAATWQRFIDTVIGEDLKPFVFVYLDDIITVSQTFEQHMALLEEVFKRLEQAGLTVNFNKCCFCREELKYLGYVINQFGLQVDPGKVLAIHNFKRPCNATEVKRLIGMASWYRRFVPNFSTIMAPLHHLTGKDVKFLWSEDCEVAFQTIKEKLTSAPVLACPDFDKVFDLYCDASNVGLGAVLSQEGKVIAYASRSLTKQERKFFPTELECLAVLWAIEKFRGYVEGYKFNVITDHASLVWLNNLKDPCGRLGRWAVRLQQFDFTVIHRKGSEHQAPDALSRAPLDYDGESIDLITVDNLPQDKWYVEMLQLVQSKPESYPAWKVEGNQLYKVVRINNEETQWNRVVPKDFRNQVFEECHDHPLAGHMGVEKTFNRIRQLYYWPKLKVDVKKYVAKCHTCLQCKIPPFKPAGKMGSPKVISVPLQVVSSDLIGPLPSSGGFEYLVVTCDLFTKYVWIKPLRKATAKAVCTHLEQDVFLKVGVPGLLLCDNGKQYKCQEMSDLCDNYGVKILYNFYYHPQSNPTERVNRVIKTMLAAYVKENHKSWSKNIHLVSTAINTSVHEVTKFTPHRLLFGEEWRGHGGLRPVDYDGTLPPIGERSSRSAEEFEKVRGVVMKRLAEAYKRAAHYYNLRRRDKEFDVGQTVYRRNFQKSDKSKGVTKKLAPRFVGPFKIISKVGLRAYLLEDDDGEQDGPWHVGDLKETPDD